MTEAHADNASFIRKFEKKKYHKNQQMKVTFILSSHSPEKQQKVTQN